MKGFIKAAATFAVISLVSGVNAFTLDGLVSDLGTAYGSDPTGGWAAAGDEGGAGNNPNIDLKDLYVAESGGTINIGMTINADIGVTNWGKYCFLIQTDTQTSGSTTTNGWTRPQGTAGFTPGYYIGSWVDGGGGAELYQWSGSAWQLIAATYNSTPNWGFAFSANGNPGPTGGVEYTMTRGMLGNAGTLKVVGLSTGGGGGDTFQDAVSASSQNNASSWGTGSAINDPGTAATAPVTLSGFAVE